MVPFKQGVIIFALPAELHLSVSSTLCLITTGGKSCNPLEGLRFTLYPWSGGAYIDYCSYLSFTSTSLIPDDIGWTAFTLMTLMALIT